MLPILNSVENKRRHDLYWKSEEKSGEIDFYPMTLMIESTTQCNLRCVFCQQHGFPQPGVMTQARPTTLPDELLPHLVTAYRYAKFVELYGFGEPFITDRMWQIAEYMKARTQDVEPRKLFVVSNGVFQAKKENLDRALGETVNRVIFSCHAAKPETRSFLQGGSLKLVHSNARTLIQERRVRGLDKEILVAASFLAMRSNLYEMCEMLKVFFDMGVNHINLNTLIRFAPEHMQQWRVKRNGQTFCYADELLDTESAQWKDEFAKALEIADSYGKKLSYNRTLESKLEHQTVKDCWFPYRACSISTNGNVYPCCENNNKAMGNLHTQSFEDIWFGSKYSNMRKMMAKDIIPPICKNRLCSYISRNS